MLCTTLAHTADGQVSPYANFPAVAAARGFLPMENTTRWDWNSNDADVCCITKDQGSAYSTNTSWVIWGAGKCAKFLFFFFFFSLSSSEASVPVRNHNIFIGLQNYFIRGFLVPNFPKTKLT